MARGFHRGSAVRTRGPQRQTTWVGPADQNFVSVASGAKVIIGSFDAAANGLPSPTVIRSRGEVAYKVNAVMADVNLAGAYGVAIVSDRAFTAGAASIPGPFTDAGWDGWFVWRSFSTAFEFADATGRMIVSERQEVDSKAMRKITDDETLVLMCESQAGAVDISMQLRFLFKLS